MVIFIKVSSFKQTGDRVIAAGKLRISLMKARGNEMESAFRVGVDVGSTTIKIVILNERNSIVFQQYSGTFPISPQP
jgi:activator of 2-hydroxyglutaryl-CoA dehydratase